MEENLQMIAQVLKVLLAFFRDSSKSGVSGGGGLKNEAISSKNLLKIINFENQKKNNAE